MPRNFILNIKRFTESYSKLNFILFKRLNIYLNNTYIMIS